MNKTLAPTSKFFVTFKNDSLITHHWEYGRVAEVRFTVTLAGGALSFHQNIYRPPTKLREGNVFTGVCHSVGGGVG